MADFNPYQAPRAYVDDIPASGGQALAGRWARLGATIVDSLLLSLFLLVPLYAAGWWQLLGKPWVAIALGQLAYLLLNGYLLHTAGQTLGKKLLGIKIVRTQGEHPGLLHSYVLRYLLPQSVFGLHPLASLLSLPDVLFIFGESRRCLHDRIAGTRVVQA